MKRFVRDNALSLVAFALFLVSIVGQAFVGHRAHSEEQLAHGEPVPAFGAYLTSGHFLEGVFENMESEFLQMALFVLLTAWLIQRGSAESKAPPEEQAESSRATERDDPAPRDDAPWPVRVGGPISKAYGHSLSFALGLLFVISFCLHATTGVSQWRAEQIAHGSTPGGLTAYLSSAQFWFESLQNWQSEFFAVGALVVLTIFLRERDSPQSKPISAPHAQTGD